MIHQDGLRAGILLFLLALAGCGTPPPGMDAAGPSASLKPASAGLPEGRANPEQVARGRKLVLTRDCAGCHGGGSNPASEGWLAGADEAPTDSIGGFKVWASNLTPDAATGLGRVSERQIFNALRYGLRPGTTPDVEITSAVPGQGNHPRAPDYLSPVMPWAYWRYMSDQELWDIAAYLKHGLQPVEHAVTPSQSPPDHWASMSSVEAIGGPDLPPFPTSNEELKSPDRRDEVLHGRRLVASMACSACHGGAVNPGQQNWLSGAKAGVPPFGDGFVIGPFRTYPRNLTPDNLTGIGRFSERQIFNALRFGLRPGETPDVEITSTVPGQGGFPVQPKYLAVPMPWPAWRYLDDEEIQAVAAYLKEGVRPVRNRVPDSDGPPDFWASAYTVDRIGPNPPHPFPTAREAYRP